jgi:hypothetical protein
MYPSCLYDICRYLADVFVKVPTERMVQPSGVGLYGSLPRRENLFIRKRAFAARRRKHPQAGKRAEG